MKKRNTKPTACKLSVLGQICNLIAPHLVPKLAREIGVDSMARSFSTWSHVVSMLFAQLTHAIGLNDVCDALRLHSGPLSAIYLPRQRPILYISRVDRSVPFVELAKRVTHGFSKWLLETV